MGNPYIQELLDRANRRWNVDSADMSLGDWICANTTMKGRPFTFDRYPFQKQIADDLHPNLDCIKPSQVGLSEVQIRKSLGFIARNRGTTLIFTLPNDKMFERMSMTRIKPLVDEEKAFNLDTRNGEKPVRNKSLYQVGSSFMHVTGATEGDATSISADLVMNDEVDLTNQQMLALFNSRLQNSDWKINQRFSTPTFTNFGVDKGYQISDQHVYLCRCLACNHWNEPLFDLNFVTIPNLPGDIGSLTEIDEAMIDEHGLDLVNSYVRCEKCGAPLPLGDHSMREWVPKFPSRDHARGYRVSPFSTDRLPIQYIVSQMLRYKSRDYLRGWYNTVLGLAFTDGNARLSDTDIEQCFTSVMQTPKPDPIMPTWVGIDMGLTCHVTIGQGYSEKDMDVVEFAEVPVKELNDFISVRLERYNVIGGACDRFPYTPNADDIYALSKGKILPVEYRGQKELNLVKDDVTGDVTHAQMNRTRLLDEVARAVRNKRISFSGYGNQKSIITDHLKDMVRDEQPEKEASWVKLSGHDHYFHSLGFLLGSLKLKDYQRRTTQDPRAVAALMGANVGGTETNLFGKSERKSGII